MPSKTENLTYEYGLQEKYILAAHIEKNNWII